jgi:hypothetical protein
VWVQVPLSVQMVVSMGSIGLQPVEVECAGFVHLLEGVGAQKILLRLLVVLEFL